MCSRTTCTKCGKATWKGCGQHIEQALAGVPEQDRCHCATASTTKTKTPGLLARFFGR